MQVTPKSLIPVKRNGKTGKNPITNTQILALRNGELNLRSLQRTMRPYAKTDLVGSILYLRCQLTGRAVKIHEIDGENYVFVWSSIHPDKEFLFKADTNKELIIKIRRQRLF